MADFVLALLIFIFVRRTAPARRTRLRRDAAGGAKPGARLRHDRVGQSDSVLAALIMLSAALALDASSSWRGIGVLSVL